MNKYEVKYSYACCYCYKVIKADSAKEALAKFKNEYNYPIYGAKRIKE